MESNIKIKPKPRKDPSLYEGARGVIIGRDWALQNDINETRDKTQERGCFKDCRTCGACANSKRNNFTPQITPDGEEHGPTMSFDWKTKTWVDCRECEPYRYHDCNNGVMRDARQEAEPFTPDQKKILETTGGKPLI